MSLALIVVGAVFVLILLFDLYLALAKGGAQTISWQLYEISLKWPVIPFIVGFLCGHIFFVQHGA